METKINIAAILESKPQGTKLYSLTYGNCSYQGYTGDFGIECQSQNGVQLNFDEYGKYCIEGECILFPSKLMRDWRKFAWKKGDILLSKDNNVYIIFEKFEDDAYTRFKGKHYLWKRLDEEDYSKEESQMLTSVFEKVNDHEAQTYINTIEERLGGKLNLETLEIEKAQPEFNDGDIVLVESYMLGINTNSMIAIFRKEKEIDEYKFSPALCESIEHDTYLREDPVVLSPSDIKIFRPATDSEKQQLFDALAKEGKAWDAEKKMIVNLKPKIELKPFEKVLVRDSESDKWRANLFGYIDKDEYYHCVYANWVYCIPYIGNESLLGTTKDVEG